MAPLACTKHPHKRTCMHTDTGLRSGNVSQHAISLFLPPEVLWVQKSYLGHKFTPSKKRKKEKPQAFLKKRAWQLLVCRYSSRPPNGWNNLMKIRQSSRLERKEKKRRWREGKQRGDDGKKRAEAGGGQRSANRENNGCEERMMRGEKKKQTRGN